MASNGITARRSSHRIWIPGKKSLVKRAPGLPVHEAGYVCSEPDYSGEWVDGVPGSWEKAYVGRLL